MKECQEKIEKNAGTFKLELDEKGQAVEKFEKEIFRKLDYEDRKDVIIEL